MKVHLAKVSLALLSTVFLLGCQEQGSGPVGPDGTGIQAVPGMGMGMGMGGDGGDDPKVGLLFFEPTFSCADGAIDNGSSFGTVSWENVRRQDSHIHATVQLTGVPVPDGDYLIFGNQDVLCGSPFFITDFDLRPLHATSITVAGGNGEARIGLTFGSEDELGNPVIPEGHEKGPHKLWLTIKTPGEVVVLGSSAVVVELKKHKGH